MTDNGISQGVLDAFEARYHQWALLEFRHEVDHGYPALRTFPWGLARRTMELLERLHERERHALVETLAGRWVPQALLAIGQPQTQVQIEMINRFRETMLEHTLSELRVECETRTRIRRRPRRKKLAAMIHNELRPVFGGAERDEVAEGCWRYCVERNGWKISTWIDIAGRFHEISYDHCISHREYKGYLRESISLLSYFGIASQTQWSYLGEDDIAPACRCLGDLCRRFMNSVSTLLENL